MEIARENVEQAKQVLKGTLYGCLRRSDLRKIEQKMSTKLLEEETFLTITKDEIMKLFYEELEALFEERMKEERLKAAD